MTARFPNMISIIRRSVKERRQQCDVVVNKLCKSVLIKLRERNYILGFSFIEGGKGSKVYKDTPKVRIYLNPNAYRFFKLSRLYPLTKGHFNNISARRLHNFFRDSILVTTSKGLKWSDEYEVGSRKLPGGIMLFRILNS